MKAIKTITIFLAIAALIATVSCGKKIQGINPITDTDSNAGSSHEDSLDPVYGERAEFNANLVKLDDRGFKKFIVDVKPFKTDSHRQYLPDLMRFMPLPDQNLPSGKTAVVGSRVCVLYPNATLSTLDDLARLPKGIPIPFGTIIPIKGEKVLNSMEKERYGMFEFQENWNWFYRTSYNGAEGLVFGADLYGLDDDNRGKQDIGASLSDGRGL